MVQDKPETFKNQFGGRTRERTTTEWIRGYLLAENEAYVKEIHGDYCSYAEANDLQQPSYDSIRSRVWMLKELGLVEKTRTEDIPGPDDMHRAYYRVNPDADRDHPGWTDPVEVLYGRD